MNDYTDTPVSLAETGKAKEFHKGQVIFKDGQKVPCAYMVKRGTVLVYRVVNNRRVILERFSPGQIFGAVSLLSEAPFHATAEAGDFTALLPIEKPLFTSLLLKSPNPIQRILRHTLERLQQLEATATEQVSANIFLSICQLLELTWRAGGQEPLSHGEFSRSAKSILAVSQLEIDTVVEKLAKLSVVRLEQVKTPTFGADPFGKTTKKGEKVQQTLISIINPATFPSVTKNLSEDVGERSGPFTEGLEWIDLPDFAQEVGVAPEAIYKKIGAGEIPESLFFFPRSAALAFAKAKGEEFFKKTKRKRLNIAELTHVSDLVHVDNPTLQTVFGELGFRKLAVLLAAAQAEGDEDAAKKLLANCSKKIGEVVSEEAQEMAPDEAEIGEAEDALYALVRREKNIPDPKRNGSA